MNTKTKISAEILWERTRNLVMAIGGLPSVLGMAGAVLLMGDGIDGETRVMLLGILGTLAGGGIAVGLTVARQWLFPMMQDMGAMNAEMEPLIRQFSEQIEKGNFGGRIEMTDKSLMRNETMVAITEQLNRVGMMMQQTVGNILDVAENVENASNSILQATNEQIANATDQDSSVLETSSTVQEVRATVTETAERAAAVAEMAKKSVAVSKAGEQSVADAIQGMNLIRQRVESIADKILVLSEHTQQIGEIIATVSALADQSKLLALNASVEAARAGAEGKGFAVVAMEVRNLAEQSREATAQVRDILSEIQQATNGAVMVTEEGTKGVDVGMALVNRAGESIRDLASTIEEASYAAIQIAASTRQQTVGMDQLTTAINNIRQTTAQATSSTMAVERAARELNKIARRLGEAASQFTSEGQA